MGKKFYKYRSAEKLLKYKELERQEIFFATPKELNDPMEAYKTIVFKGDEILWHNLFNTYFHFYSYSEYKEFHLYSVSNRSFNQVYNIFRNNINTLVKILSGYTIYKYELEIYLLNITLYIKELLFEFYITKNRFTFQEDTKLARFRDIILLFILGLLKERNKHYNYRLLSKILTNPNISQTTLLSEINKVENFMKYLEHFVSPSILSTSFSRNNNNTLMWTHYADNHNGVCLIFDTNENNSIELASINDYNSIIMDRILTEQLYTSNKSRVRYKYTSEICEIKPIKYSIDLKPINFFENIWLANEEVRRSWFTDSITNKISNIYDTYENNNFKQNIVHNVMNKTKEWKYEKEWRITYFASSGISIPLKFRKFKYNFQSLNGLIFGLRTSIELRHKIINIIVNKCKKDGRKKFNFYEMQINSKNGKLKKSQLDININQFN